MSHPSDMGSVCKTHILEENYHSITNTHDCRTPCQASVYTPVLVMLQSSFLRLVWYMMTTHTSDVPTTQQTTAMITTPTVAHPSSSSDETVIWGESQVGVGITLRRTWPRSVPRVLDISHVYFPASLTSESTMISSWLPAAKKCLSVTTKGLSSLVQFSLGGGLPPAMHCRTAVSPLVTVRSNRGRKNDGVSEMTGSVFYLLNDIRFCIKTQHLTLFK